VSRFNANGDGPGIWVIDADGSHPRRLTARASDGEPAWSPTGSQIVFTRRRGDFRLDLWLMRRDGSHQTRLIKNGSSASWQPVR
jgi:Tol biopolymer transport system component